MNAELLAALEAAQRSLAEIGSSLTARNDHPSTLVAPTTQQGVNDQGSADTSLRRMVLSPSDQYALREKIRFNAAGQPRSIVELNAMFYEQARQKNTGIPLDTWLASGGAPRVQKFAGIGEQLDPDVQRALDTAGASALIRQDLEPVLYELYIREFPAFDRITKEPANGLTHTFQQLVSFGGAQFMAELGTVTDDKSVYRRETTNVAIIATRRGVSLKSQFATIQSGSGFNPEQLELQGGLRAISHRMQQAMFSGHSTDTGGTDDNELGLYDENGFTGLRSILNTSRAVNVDPEEQGGAANSMRRAVNRAAIRVMQNAGRTGITWMNPLTKEPIDNQQDQNVRYTNELVNISVGVNTNAINTVFGATPLGVVPGDAIGSYHSAEYEGKLVRDLYLLDESVLSMPYLGSEGPTVLDIPIGISGQLTHLFIIFGMWGLAVKAPTFQNKVRVAVPDDE